MEFNCSSLIGISGNDIPPAPSAEEVSWAEETIKEVDNLGRMPGGPAAEEISRAVQIQVEDIIHTKMFSIQLLFKMQTFYLENCRALSKCSPTLSASPFSRRMGRRLVAMMRGLLSKSNRIQAHILNNAHRLQGPEKAFSAKDWEAKSTVLEALVQKLEELLEPLSAPDEILDRLQQLCDGDSSISVTMQEVDDASEAFLRALSSTSDPLDLQLFSRTLLDLVWRVQHAPNASLGYPIQLRWVTFKWLLRLGHELDRLRQERKFTERAGSAYEQEVHHMEQVKGQIRVWINFIKKAPWYCNDGKSDVWMEDIAKKRADLRKEVMRHMEIEREGALKEATGAMVLSKQSRDGELVGPKITTGRTVKREMEGTVAMEEDEDTGHVERHLIVYIVRFAPGGTQARF